jgi:hypothetical protein
MKTKTNKILSKITLHIETLFIVSPFIGQRIFFTGWHKLTLNRSTIIQAEIAVVKAKNGLFEFNMMPAENAVD